MKGKGKETMGQRLQRLRQAARLTQAELARRAGVPLRSLLNWEQDRRQPRLDAVVDLARLLGVPLEELLTNLAPREQRPPARKGRPPATGGARAGAGKVEARPPAGRQGSRRAQGRQPGAGRAQRDREGTRAARGEQGERTGRRDG
jgi:transcriptional regulator with XRE-family HTH domain